MKVIEKKGVAVLVHSNTQYNAKAVSEMTQKQFKEVFKGAPVEIHKACKAYFSVAEAEEEKESD